MPGRRDNNDGSVYQDKDGIWWAQLPANEHGKRPKRRAKTKREAQEKLHAMKREREQGVDLTARRPRLDSFLATWLEQTIKPPKRAPKTYESYEQIIRLYIAPGLGDIRIDKITPPLIENHLSKLLEEYNPRVAQYAHAVLRAALGVAVQWKYISVNPAALVKGPRVQRREMTPLTSAEAQRLLAAIEGHRLAALYAVALWLGLRQGEVLGLRWADVDWQQATLRIAQTVQSRKGGTKINPTTKGRKVRYLPIPPHLLEVLRVHQRNQLEEKRLPDTRWKEHGLVFASEVGTPIGQRNLLTHFKALLKRADLSREVRFHDLRHTTATLLVEAGVPLKIISAILGHSSVSVTGDIYAHAVDETVREAVGRLKKAMGE